MSGLPEGWLWSTLGEVCDRPQYGWTTKADRDNTDGLKLLRTTDITNGPIDWVTVPSCTDEPENVGKYQLNRGDLVISRAGSVGVSALIDRDPPPAVFASYLIRMRPVGADPRYVKWFMQSSAYWREIEESAAGIALQNVNAKKLAAIRVPVAPPDEQQRIVEAIEEQLSRLDAGVASLQRAKRNLSRMRASILKAAVEGRLSRPQAAPGVVPDGWVTASPEDLAAPVSNALAIGPFGSNLKVSDYTSSGVPLVFVRNIRRRRFDGDDMKYVTPEKAAELHPHEVLPGDLLITKMGDPPGDAAVYSGTGPAIITADCIKLRPRDGVDVRYLDISFNSPVIRSQILGITRGVAQKKVSLGRFRNEVRVPLPPPPEQAAIVAEVERRLSVLEAMESTLSFSLARAESLRRSTLREAFSGRLSRASQTVGGLSV